MGAQWVWRSYGCLRAFCCSVYLFVGVAVWATGRVWVGYGAPVYACVGAGDVPSGRGDSSGSENGQTGRHTFDSLFNPSSYLSPRDRGPTPDSGLEPTS